MIGRPISSKIKRVYSGIRGFQRDVSGGTPTPTPTDSTPDAFSFTDVTGANLSTVTESNAITVAGINDASTITITGGEYQKNGGSWVSSSGTVANGDSVKVRGTSSGSYETAVNVVLTIGGVSDTFTITTELETPEPGAINAPVIAQTSAAGAVPFEWSTTGDSTVFAGDIWELSVSATDDVDVDGAFDTPIAVITKMISPSEFDPDYEALWLTSASPPASADFITPSGTFYFQMRVLRHTEDGTISSPYSNMLTETIVSATTVLHATNGVNKNQFLVVTDRTAALNRDDIGAACMARATQEPTSDKTQFEVTLTAIQPAHSTIIAIDGGTAVYGANSYDVPGTGGRAGICLRMHEAYSDIIASGVDVSVGAAQDGDIISVTIDKTNGNIKFYRTRSGSTTQLGTTYTPTLTSWYAAIGHVRTAEATINFGQDAFARALDSGFAIHG